MVLCKAVEFSPGGRSLKSKNNNALQAFACKALDKLKQELGWRGVLLR